MNRTGPIVLGGSVLLVVLVAMSWLLVLSPRLGEASELSAQAESVEAQTAKVESEIAELKALARDLPNQVAKFDELKATFPSTAELPAVLDQIRNAAAQTGVTVEALETSPPELVAPVTTDPAAATDAAADESAATTAEGDSVGVPAASAADGNLATMPFTLTVTGSFDQIKAFLAAAETLPRAWLIDNVSVQGGQEGGTLSLTATGSMFVMDTTGTAVPPTATTSER